MTKINTKDISVVIQGALDKKYIGKTLKSIRKELPQAEIILSTWEGTDVSELDYDILVLNEDPGAAVFTPDGRKQNQNRQIFSTQNGIKKATRKYVLKIRSDMEIKGTRFLSYFGKYTKRNPECKILKERILINSLYTRNSLMQKSKKELQPYLFHPSDWMMFGLKEDMLNIWDIPLAPEPETSQYFATHPNLPHDKGCLTRWHAEQYIWLSFLEKNGFKLNYDNYFVYNEESRRLSELSIVNNTTLLEYKKQFDILCQKYLEQYGDSPTMHPFQWMKLYKEFCDPSFVIPLKWSWKEELHIQQNIFHFSKHLNRLIKPIKYFPKWIEQLLNCAFYFCKIILSVIRYLPTLILSKIKKGR